MAFSASGSRQRQNFNLNGWNKWGVPQYDHVMKCKGKPPKLFGPTGGELKIGYKSALQRIARLPGDSPEKRHSEKLLAQFGPVTPPKPASSRPKTANSQNWSYWSKDRDVTLKIEGKTLNKSRDTSSEVEVTSQKQQEVALDTRCDYKRGNLRPKTAMASIGNQFMNPYATSYDLNYGQVSNTKMDQSSSADRPATSRGYTASYRLSGPIGRTHFNDEYGLKKGDREVPIRSGTSSGSRSNNPHPDKEFMIWRYPKERSKGEAVTGAPASNRNYRELTDGVLDEIVRDSYRSTYDKDYMGIPQGYQMKDAIGAPNDWMEQVPRPADTSFRRTYVTPVQHPAHKVGTSRYDCNKLYVKPAVGIVPTVNKQQVVNQKNVKENTVYVDEYFNRGVNYKLNKILNQRLDRNWEQIYLKTVASNTPAATEVEVLN